MQITMRADVFVLAKNSDACAAREGEAGIARVRIGESTLLVEGKIAMDEDTGRIGLRAEIGDVIHFSDEGGVG